MQTQMISVPHSQGQYPIYIGQHLLQDAELFKGHIVGTQVMIVTNNTLANLYLPTLLRSLEPFQTDNVILPDGEAYKTIASWQKILMELAQQHHHRDTTLIALGGGVVGDITGFAAATYHRGVNFIQVPTTLLSQVDASIGGKTGVNLEMGKNLVGAFYQPRAVIIDVNTLISLNDREYRAGLAEIIKAALICDKKFFNYLEEHWDQLIKRDLNILIECIKKACGIKADIVAADEREQGLRALLNLGHTFAHAAEKCLGYGKWLHGEAVAWGLLQAAELSQQLKQFPAEDVERIRLLIAKALLPNKLPTQVSVADIITAIKADKKILHDRLRLILLQEIGHAVITEEVSESMLRNFLESGVFS